MRKFIYIVKLISIILFFTSCGELKKSNTNNQDSPDEVTEQRTTPPQVEEVLVTSHEEFQENFVVKVEPEKDPYKYRVLLNWKKFNIPKLIRIKRGTQITETDQTLGYFVYSVEHNQNFLFDIDVLNSDRQIEYSFTKEVSIPRDFVVTETNDVLNFPLVSKNVGYYKLNRLYLNTSRPLLVSHAIADIEVNELYADSYNESIIGNYLYNPNQELTAPQNTDGRNGGNIQVRIKNLYGKVHFIMKGEKGGSGLKGPSWDVRAPNGSDGRDREKYCSSINSLDSYYTIQRPCEFLVQKESKKTFKNINIKQKVNENIQPQRCGGGPITCECRGTVQNPTPGQNGEKGRTGLTGKAGGKSGDINITVENILRDKPLNPDDHQLPEEFVKVSLIPGGRGNGGEGGDGQLGGIGGVNSKGYCRSTGPERVEGQQGPKGDQGPFGIEGLRGTSCISIAKEGVNFCQ